MCQHSAVTTSAGALDVGTAYLEVQHRLLDEAADPARHGVRVPACPDWTVRDVVAHLAGLAHDAVTGALPPFDLLEQWRDASVAAERDSMTEQQVARSREREYAEIVDEWGRTTDALVPILRGEQSFPGTPPFGLDAILLTDLWVHDADVRGALDLPRAADGAATSIGLAAYGFGVADRVRKLELPAMALRYGEKTRVLGDGDPVATVAAERYELVRMLAGRRSRKQIAAMDWDGDPEPYLAIIPAYGERDTDLVD